MSEETVVMSLPAPEQASVPQPRAQRSGSGAALLLALIALVVAGYATWRTWELQRASQGNVDPQALAARIEMLSHTVEQLRGNADTLRTRMDDTAKVDKSEREELLGLGERARLLEDAVANLADKRLSARDTLALDEAELLLLVGGERYAVFHDPAAAVGAYRAADGALAQVEDAAFSTVRQSIGAEIEAFRGVAAADTARLAAKLTQLRAQLAQLPVQQQLAPAAAAEPDSRLWRVLGAFVQVHHANDAQTELARRDVGLARELITLDVRQAEAALLARNDALFHAALASARAQLAAFDAAAAPVVAVRDALDALDKSALAPPTPELTGTALKELRNLRATHALRAGAAAHSVAPKADEAPK